jgi:hypothetical protein
MSAVWGVSSVGQSRGLIKKYSGISQALAGIEKFRYLGAKSLIYKDFSAR